MSNSPINKNRGFTLLEALIGFLILSIGMLGIASLQAISLQSGKASVYRSVAMMKVDELLESMRANPTAIADYATVIASTGTPKNCMANTCTGADVALNDVYLWHQNLKAGLPGVATTAVTVDGLSAASKLATVKVTVTWEERNKDSWSKRDADSADSAKISYTTTADICSADPC